MVAFMHTGTRLTAGYRYTTLGDATHQKRAWFSCFRNFAGICAISATFTVSSAVHTAAPLPGT